MKLSRLLLVAFLFIAPTAYATSDRVAAERAWKPFFTAFRVAVKKRDRAALRNMMSSDFYSSPGNDAGIDAAFRICDEKNGERWRAFNAILNQGTVPMAAWWDRGAKRKYITRVAPPAANVRRNIDRAWIDWYALFEFRHGHWYCTIFSECCD